MVCSDKFVFKEFLYNKKTIPFMSLQLVDSMMEFFDDIPLNMRKFKYPLLLMMAEHEQLVSNTRSEQCFDRAGSFIKEKVLFKGAYHELQKDLLKDRVHARVLQFITGTIMRGNP
jgi:esterase/lipase